MAIEEKLITIAENQQNVYNAGYEKGKAENDNYYDFFWDNYQEGGKRTSYIQAFRSWCDACFYPKYDLIVGTNPIQMFAYCSVANLKKRLEECGVVMDFTNATQTNSVFSGAQTKELPELNMSNTTSINYLFESANKLETVDKLILPTSGNFTTLGAFNVASSLKNILIEGTISSSINLQWSPLTKESLLSVIGALSTTATGQTITLNKTAVNSAFDTTTWKSITDGLPNWTFTLI